MKPKLSTIEAAGGHKLKNKLLSEFVKDRFKDNPNEINILEAGCGQRWPLDLGPLKYRLTGLDISPESLEIRQKKENDLDAVIIADLGSVNLPKKSFDVIYCAYVLEHITGAENLLKNFKGWLKDDGVIILLFPDRESLFGTVARYTPQWFHVFYYKHIRKFKNAGQPGHAPFQTYYEPVTGRSKFREFCDTNDLEILVEYGIETSSRQLLGRFDRLFTPIKGFYRSILKIEGPIHGGLIYIMGIGKATENPNSRKQIANPKQDANTSSPS